MTSRALLKVDRRQLSISNASQELVHAVAWIQELCRTDRKRSKPSALSVGHPIDHLFKVNYLTLSESIQENVV